MSINVRKVTVGVLGAILLALMLFTPAVSGGAAEASHRDPILFVHGFSGNSTNWDIMRSRFIADGWEADRLFAYTFSSTSSNATVAQDVANRVAQIKAATGASKVDIITHSMGGLSTRYYLKNLGGTAHVDEWVSIGGPNHGTTWAYACFLTPCFEMRPGSSFLNALNAGDETPGGVRYGTFWSPCDEVINPDTSTILSGATNTQTLCIGHLSLIGSWTVYWGVRDFVQ